MRTSTATVFSAIALFALIFFPALLSAQLWTNNMMGGMYNTPLTINVGIGLDVPEYPLHVYSSDDLISGVFINNNNSIPSWGLAALRGDAFPNTTLLEGALLVGSSVTNTYGIMELGVSGTKNALLNPLALGAVDPGSAQLHVTGSVGIGTAEPAAPLHLVGNAFFAIAKIGPDSDGGGYSEWQFLENRAVAVGGIPQTPIGMAVGYEGGRDIMYVQPALDGALQANPHLSITLAEGKVGMSTGQPQANLHVVSRTANARVKIAPNTENNGYSEIHLLENRADGPSDMPIGMAIGYDGGRDILYVQGAVDDALAVDPHLSVASGSGRVGVGTDNPEARFHVDNADSDFSGLFEQDNGIPGNWALSAQRGDIGQLNLLRDALTGALAIGAQSGEYGLLEAGATGSTNVMINPLVLGSVNTLGAQFRATGNARIEGTLRVGLQHQNTGAHTDYRLSVDGKVVARELVITDTDWADFVFEPDYTLPPLEDVKKHIDRHGHLPEIPSADDVRRNGVAVGEIQVKLLQKIEELTLYTIKQNDAINSLTEHNRRLQAEIEQLKTR